MKAFKDYTIRVPLDKLAKPSIRDMQTNADMRVGARVFRAGSPVDDVLAAAAQAYKDNPLPVVQPEPKKPLTWLQEMYALTASWHMRTGRKVPIGDLLDAFMVTNMRDIEPEDQPVFEARLRERLGDE